ncbi:MAG TPA: class I SAM-dependent methyltransferase [Pyrinomonadaceae bacterium]|nr:class I SAM-dependent methyltransferase [Pyrinomonadaceae bacterium]
MKNSSPLIGEFTPGGVIIDIGTGDGRFVYQSARQNPNKFYIGIDPNVKPLEKISEKVHRKPAKGGAPNVLFVQSAVEDLPAELDGVADEVHVHFPWGSLLRAFVTADVEVLRNVRRICSPGALLEVVINDHIADQLIERYRSVGFEVLEHGSVPASQWSEFETTWARKLKQNERRSVVYLIARAV